MSEQDNECPKSPTGAEEVDKQVTAEYQDRVDAAVAVGQELLVELIKTRAALMERTRKFDELHDEMNKLKRRLAHA